MVTVLITGGAGFIGHNLALYLASRGFDVAVYDSLERSSGLGVSRLREKGVPIIVGDVRDEDMLRNALREADVVVHAAAYVSVEESVRRPLMYFSNNVLGTVSAAKCSLDCDVDFLVYLSSAAVYGNPKYLPIDENHPTKPIYKSGRLGDIRRSVADISKIARILGFKPKVSLEQGLEMLFKYG